MNKEENHKKSTRRRFPNHPHQYHKALASLFHTHKQPDPTESGHDGRPMAANVASSRGSIREKSITPPDSLSSSSLARSTPLQATQLLLVPSSSSHVPPPPPRSRSNHSLTQSSISMTFTDNDHPSSLRSAYSNEDDGGIHADPPPSSLNRSDRLQIYHFGTPTYSGANQYHDHDDYASSRFSYDAQSQLHSSSSRYNQDQRRQQKQRSRTPLSYLKRSYFSSSFASSGKRKSVASQSGCVDHTATTPSSSSSSSVRRTVGHRASHILFLGRRLPDFETLVYCSECEKWIQSRLRYRNGSMVWLAAFVLLMCTVFLFWIPFYTKYFKDTVHYCPSCHGEIGRHSVL